MSRWAEPFVRREPNEAQRALLADVLAIQDAARERQRRYGRRFVIMIAASIAAFIVSTCPMPFWLGMTIWWSAVAFGAYGLRCFFEWNFAAYEAGLWPDELSR